MEKWKRCLWVIFIVMLCCEVVFAYDVVDLGPIVVTGARMEQASGQYGGNMTVLGQREIAESGASDMTGLLASAAGVFVTQKSTSRSGVADIRGFGDTADRNVLILINGRKLNNPDNFAVDLSRVPLETIERIEIIRGAGSVLYGDNAVGGVINIITKKGKGPISGSLGVSVGSYGARKTSVDAGGSEGSWAYFLSSQYAENKGYRSNSDVLAKDGNLRLDYSLAERMSLGFDMMWHEDSYGLPGGLNAAGLVQYGRRGSDEEGSYGKTTDRTFGWSAEIKPWEDPSIDGTVTVDYSFRNQDSYGWFDYGAGEATGTKRAIDTHAVLSKYVHKGMLDDRRWNIVTGIDLYDVTNDILGSGTGFSASTDDLTISKEELGLYTYGEFEVMPKLFAGTGLRYQQADYTFDQRNGAAQYIEKSPTETVKKGLIRYEYADGSNIYGSVEETFRFLSTDEWYSTWTGLNTTLQHQTGIQYEVGWKHDFNGNIQTSVVPYWIENKNEIFVDPTYSPGNNKNYDEILRRGVEVSSSVDLKKIFEIDPFKRLQLDADYTYQKASFQDGVYSGYDVPMSPRNQAAVRFSAQWNNGFGVSLSETVVGSRYVINDTDNQMPKEKMYFRTDLKLFMVQQRWEAFIAVNNLFGKKYNDYAARSTGGSSNIEYYPAAEMEVEVGAKVRF
jgi:iron complex outermembrane receptor protein